MVKSSFVVGVFDAPLEFQLSAIDSASLFYGDLTGLTFCGAKTFVLDGESTFASINDGKLALKSQPVGIYFVNVVSSLSH